MVLGREAWLPYQGMFRVLGEDRVGRLLRSVGYRPTGAGGASDQIPWRHNGRTPAPGHLFLTAYRLAQVNELLNPRGSQRPDPQFIARFLSRRPHALPYRASHTIFE